MQSCQELKLSFNDYDYSRLVVLSIRKFPRSRAVEDNFMYFFFFMLCEIFFSLYYNRIEIFFNMNLKNIGYKHSLSLVEILSCTYLFTDNQLRGVCVCMIKI